MPAWGGCSRRRDAAIRVILFTWLAFSSHYFGDYFFTTWPLCYLFSLSRRAFMSRCAFPLWHPINRRLGMGFTLGALILRVVFRRTPLDVLSPRADAALVDFVAKRFRARGVRRMNP
jgi:hypothetical protein